MGKLIALLVFIGSVAYLNLVQISPVYFLYTVALFLSLVYKSLLFRRSNYIIIFPLVVVIFLAWYNNANISVIVGLITGYLAYFILSGIAVQNLKVPYLKVLYYFLIPWFSFEMIYRFMNPGDMSIYLEKGRGDILFYIYKINSPFFADSNGVGAMIVLTYVFYDVLNRLNVLHFSTVPRIIILVLILGTLSRSAVVGVLFYIILYSKGFLLRLLMILAGLYGILGVIGSDDSFSTKTSLIEKALGLNLSIENWFLGIGFGLGHRIFGIGTHNIFLTLLFEGGLLYFIIYLLFLGYNYVRAKEILPLLLVYFLMGMSYMSLSTPYFFVFVTLIVYESKGLRINSGV